MNHFFSWLLFLTVMSINVTNTTSIFFSGEENSTKNPIKVPDMATYRFHTERFFKAASKVVSAETKISNVLSGGRKSKERACTINRKVAAATEEEAYTFGRYAAVAYCKAAQDIQSWNCTGHCLHPVTRGIRDVTVVDDAFFGIKYFMGIDWENKWLIVSFRGTIYHPLNMILDFLLFPVRFNDLRPDFPKRAKIHFGFKNNYLLIRKRLLKLFRSYWNSYPEVNAIKVTGHSMGGALAELFALDIEGNGQVAPGQIQIFTYGAPRLGNLDYVRFASSIGFKTITRVTSNNDVIPLLPPRTFSYAHSGQELHLEGLYPNITSPISGNNWSLKRLKRYYADTANSTVTATRCNLDCLEYEDEKCALSHTKHWSSASHLQAWDINFGTWC